jgi:hypothetical protein
MTNIQQWLEETKLEMTHNVLQDCPIHSFPQANFMLNANANANNTGTTHE